MSGPRKRWRNLINSKRVRTWDHKAATLRIADELEALGRSEAARPVVLDPEEAKARLLASLAARKKLRPDA